MSQHANLLFSKIIDENNPQALVKYGITERDLTTDGERATYRFIRDYVEKNGQVPSYATVTAQCPAFIHTPMVSDPYEYLAKQIKQQSAVSQFEAFVNEGELQQLFNEYGEKDMQTFIDVLQKELESIKMNTNIRSKIGRTLDEIKSDFKAEYLKREEGKSSKRWNTPFDQLTKVISGWFSGDVYGIMAESGRGKTYLIGVIVDSLLRQGATVLLKEFEVKEFVFFARLVSIITAVDETFTDELGRKVGIPNKEILSGSLEDIVRDKFIEVIDALDSYYPGKLYFQGKSDKSLTRTLDDLERELLTSAVDVVILDPFYGLTDVYGKNANKTAGGAAEYAATRFEQIIGDNDVVGFYTVQATVEKKQTDEDGERELKIPTRDQVKTSKRLLDIATNLIGFDSVEKQHIAMLGIEKGRNGGEDFRLELTALFDYGVLRELPTGEEAAKQFGF
ncbi:DNA helicase [Niallia sp. FSL M8-0099]|uniref:DNA helicase n=1 Tax=Niallia sp. FSL M8-0099 TaxID=2954519 RepID=UPI0030FC372B